MSTSTRPFADRSAAGRALADRLADYGDRDNVVLGLPRGGVPVAVPVAEALNAPLDILVVRKLGLPGHPELAMGAIAGVGGDVEMVHNQRVLELAEVSQEDLDAVYDKELVELRRREEAYRDGRPAQDVHGKVAIVVDDGLATGSTVLAAVAAVRHQEPTKVVVAVPIGSREACARLRTAADEVVCDRTPTPFYAVGQGYQDFTPTQDEEVRAALSRASGTRGRSAR